MQLNTFDPAEYWRKCDLWTYDEVLFLLDGHWPEAGKKPPTGLSLTVVSHPEDSVVLASAPTDVPFANMIQDAIDARKLTPVQYGSEAHWKRDFEQRFIPSEVIEWAVNRGCFPNFPYLPNQQLAADSSAGTAAKLSASQKSEVVRLHNAGISESELSRRFSVHRSTINRTLVAAGQKKGRSVSKGR